jgi:putative hydrolases of HD superfamily
MVQYTQVCRNGEEGIGKGLDGIVEYIFELGVMKRRRIAGFDHFMSQQSSTLASHSHRAAMIGMALAELEGANIQRVAAMLLVHEIGEVRVGDTDNVAGQYRNPAEAEHRAVSDQNSKLPARLGELLIGLYQEVEGGETLEARVAKDADLLEYAFSAKEYVDQGIQGGRAWLGCDDYLRTESGKQMLRKLRDADSNAWWIQLNNM